MDRPMPLRAACDRRPIAADCRRGNTLVLVTAILVLLVIIATAYVGRTRSIRATAAAQQQAAVVIDRSRVIGGEIANEVAEALFVRPVEVQYDAAGAPIAPPQDAFFGGTVSSNWPRLPILPDEVRYGIDRLRLTNASGERFYAFPYNVAPYATIPWTNWPDDLAGDFNPPVWPVRSGDPEARERLEAGAPFGDGNPYGNPGFGDSRWLRSTEPQRVFASASGTPVEQFTHWLHLSNLSRPDNAWRVCWDISDVRVEFDSTAEADRQTPTVLENLLIPVEQWLPGVVPAGIQSAADFIGRRDLWFGSLASYGFAYRNPQSALPNFFRLRDLGSPSQEFERGSDRWLVNTLFTDTDGDGFTDSFWFLAPTATDRSVRQVVGVSVVDNSGLLDVNAASVFERTSTAGANPADLALTDVDGRGGGLLDNFMNRPPTLLYNLGLVPGAQLQPADGFLSWDPARFGAGAGNDPSRFLQQIGMRDADGTPNPLMVDGSMPEALRGTLASPFERLAYFNRNFRLDGPDSLSLTPFGTPEEIELRGHHGQNNPAVNTRLERAIDDRRTTNAFLRAAPNRSETIEYLEQLGNPQLVHDNRRKITAFSGARNDIAPPWLWTTPRFDPAVDYNRDGFVLDLDGDDIIEPNESGQPDAAALFAADRAAWEFQRFKLDLRQPMDEPTVRVDAATGAAEIAAAAPEDTIASNRRLWRDEMRRLIKQSTTLDYTLQDGTTAFQSLFGEPDHTVQQGRDAWLRTRRMAASYAANIDQWRDGPEEVTLPDGSQALLELPLNPRKPVEMVIFPDPSDEREVGLATEQVAYIGVEKHPVVVEVFVALVYPRTPVDPAWAAAGGPTTYGQFGVPWSPGQGENFVQFGTDPSTGFTTPEPAVVFAVQLANPFDTPIHLANFSVRAFGRTFPLLLGASSARLQPPPDNPTIRQNYTLQPTTPERPCSLVLYSIPQSFGGDANFRQNWLDYLDLQPDDLFNDPTTPGGESLVVDATSVFNFQWNAFNDPNAEGVEVVQRYGDQVHFVEVVVDRYGKERLDDPSEFAQGAASILYRADYQPPQPSFNLEFLPPPSPANTPDPERTWYSGIRIGQNDFFINWVRASRLWLRDLPDASGLPNGFIDLDERMPRFAISAGTEVDGRLSAAVREWPVAIGPTGGRPAAPFKGDAYRIGQNPDASNDGDMWLQGFTFESQFHRDGDLPIRSKPTFFPMQAEVQGDARVYEGYRYEPFDPRRDNEVRWGEKGAPKASAYRDEQFFGRFPFQMGQKDRDFEQIGELANVWLWGPEIRFPVPGNGRAETNRTLSEILAERNHLASDTHPVERGVHRNRLRVDPGFNVGIEIDPEDGIAVDGDRPSTPVLGSPPGGLTPEQRSEWEAAFAYRPLLPAGVGLFDGVVCDGRGMFLTDVDGSGVIDGEDLRLARLLAPANARGFTGAATPGLVNLNTAPVEVLRTLPHFTRLAYNDGDFGGFLSETVPVQPTIAPRVRLPETIVRYRDLDFPPTSSPSWGEGQFGSAGYWTNQPLADYRDRGLNEDLATLPNVPGIFQGMRNQRGFESIGELRLLQRPSPGNDDGSWNRRVSGSIEFAGLDPYRGLPDFSEPDDVDFGYRGRSVYQSPNGVRRFEFDTRLATDRTVGGLPIDSGDPSLPANGSVPDATAGDAEERNLLFAGVSNLVGVRSDLFTVSFRIRTFRQNPITGRWDATDPEHILDDSRYVMLVDRSKVERPGDQPRIVYLQKLPY